MTKIIIANILSAVDIILMALSMFQKDKKKLFLLQTLKCPFTLVANLLLGGYPGVVTSVNTGIKNTLLYFDKMTKGLTYAILISTGVTGLIFNNMGIIGLLPIVATIEYALVMCIKDVKAYTIKVSFLINILMWLVYDICIINISAFVGHIILTVITAYNLVKETLPNHSIKT